MIKIFKANRSFIVSNFPVDPVSDVGQVTVMETSNYEDDGDDYVTMDSVRGEFTIPAEVFANMVAAFRALGDEVALIPYDARIVRLDAKNIVVKTDSMEDIPLIEASFARVEANLVIIPNRGVKVIHEEGSPYVMVKISNQDYEDYVGDPDETNTGSVIMDAFNDKGINVILVPDSLTVV